MLIDIALRETDPATAVILRCVSGGYPVTPQRLRTGVYECRHWNFEEFVSWPRIEAYPTLESDGEQVSAYGVCDSVTQLLTTLRPCLSDPLRMFVVAVVCVCRDEQPANGGWRWHKWGPYIGAQQPTMEYLADEPDIDKVWTYHILELLPLTEEANPAGIH